MKLKVKFTAIGAEDFDYWESVDSRVLDKIKRLLRDACEHPFVGIGKPEPLKHDLSGCWSRRITKEHRLVYAVVEDVLVVHQCRFHYGAKGKKK